MKLVEVVPVVAVKAVLALVVAVALAEPAADAPEADDNWDNNWLRLDAAELLTFMGLSFARGGKRFPDNQKRYPQS